MINIQSWQIHEGLKSKEGEIYKSHCFLIGHLVKAMWVGMHPDRPIYPQSLLTFNTDGTLGAVIALGSMAKVKEEAPINRDSWFITLKEPTVGSQAHNPVPVGFGVEVEFIHIPKKAWTDPTSYDDSCNDVSEKTFQAVDLPQVATEMYNYFNEHYEAVLAMYMEFVDQDSLKALSKPDVEREAYGKRIGKIVCDYWNRNFTQGASHLGTGTVRHEGQYLTTIHFERGPYSMEGREPTAPMHTVNISESVESEDPSVGDKVHVHYRYLPKGVFSPSKGEDAIREEIKTHGELELTNACDEILEYLVKHHPRLSPEEEQARYASAAEAGKFFSL